MPLLFTTSITWAGANLCQQMGGEVAAQQLLSGIRSLQQTLACPTSFITQHNAWLKLVAAACSKENANCLLQIGFKEI